MKFFRGLSGAAVGVVLALSGCAEQARNVPATYIPSLVYRGASCGELHQEQRALYAYVQHVTLAQRHAAQADFAAVFVGTLIVWPALFALPLTVDQQAQLSSARGHYDALVKAMHEQGCTGASATAGQVRSGYGGSYGGAYSGGYGAPMPGADWKRYAGQFPPL
ncbi:hypothetical protein [Pseudooceanicola marinus]|uniref:hypothetical protein n=1 Tax=Pseudooceanicola marinus TaxID=396013 RepID=UPI001CD6F3D9|nr:hypothetical protein [Pseudooceanicola marinus]MCA1336297.1 hypothetical protein [Pseudooceanicola marinus]